MKKLLLFLLLSLPALGQTTVYGNEPDFSRVCSPSQITSSQNNYDHGCGGAMTITLRLSTDASRTITGFANGVSGKVLIIQNVGSSDLVLADASSSSSAANRMELGGDQTIAAEGSIELRYDGTSSRWRIKGGSGGGGGISNFEDLGSGTNTSAALVVGSGASLATDGTGTIAATSVPWSGVSGAPALAEVSDPLVTDEFVIATAAGTVASSSLLAKTDTTEITVAGDLVVTGTITAAQTASAGNVVLSEPSGAGTNTYTLKTPADITTSYEEVLPAAAGSTGVYLGTVSSNTVTRSLVAPGTSGNVLTSNGTTWTSSAPAAAGLGYQIQLAVGVHSPANNATRFYGFPSQGAEATAANAGVPVSKACTLKAVYWRGRVTGTTDNAANNVTLTIEVNGSGGLASFTQTFNSSTVFSSSSTGLSTALSAGDVLTMKGVFPTWGVQPTNVWFEASVYCE